MASLFNPLAARLREYIGDRRSTSRYSTHLTAHLMINVSLLDAKSRPGEERPAKLAGYTRDISESGLAIVVSDTRIRGLSITKPDRPLRIMLSLPAKTIEIHVLPVRFVKLEDSDDYLIGLSITKMGDADHAVYQNYINRLGSSHFSD